MKRYTLKFQPHSSAIIADQLKSEVEQVFLRLHPRITYKMGKVHLGADGTLLVQVGLEGKREVVSKILKDRAWQLPVTFERLLWGWAIEEEAEQLIAASAPRDADPLAGVQPLEGVSDTVITKRPLQVRYTALLSSVAALILVVIANAFFKNSPPLMVLYAVLFAVFMFSLSDTPLDPRVYATKLSLGEDSLEVWFWLRSKSVKVGWENIWSIEHKNQMCEIVCKDRKFRFLLAERFGCKDAPAVLKTIVKRGGLSYVEGNFLNLLYRKPEI